MIIEPLFILIAPVIFYLINKLLVKVNFLVEDVNKSDHKRIFSTQNKKIQSGGLFLLFSLLLFFFKENIYLSVSLTLIFILGVLSDIDYVSSPLIRFLFQLIVITFLVISTPIFVENTRIEILDNFLENKNFKYVFTISCFLVLINGCNFVDGANNILIGYFLIVSVCILIVTNYLQINLDLYYLIITLLILLIFNFFSKIIMGDSGAYLIGLLFGYLTINLSNNNLSISPIYVLNLLWYPAFENLFSILRKKKINISASMADNNHLHHLIYRRLSRMFKKNKFNNSLTGVIINFFNLISLTISTMVHNHSLYLSVILIFNITIYISVYYFLSRKHTSFSL